MSESLLVVVPDIHLKRVDPLGVIDADGVNTRLKDKLGSVQYCTQYAVENKATHLVFLGDIFETVNPSERLRNMFWQVVEPAISAGIQIRIILGNHDMTGQSHNLASETITARDNIKIFVSGSHTEVIGDKVVNYVPYTETPEFDPKADIVFAHLEVDGASPAPDNMKLRGGIKREAVPGHIKLFGHIHKFQELEPGFAYLGACTRCGFGEVNENKYFGVIDLMQMTSEYIEIPQRPMYQVRVEELDTDNLYVSERVPPNLKEKGIIVEFRFVGSREWLSTLDKQAFKKRFSNAVKVEVSEEKLDADRPTVENEALSMDERVHQYATLKKKGKTVLDTGLQLLSTAKEIEL